MRANWMTSGEMVKYIKWESQKQKLECIRKEFWDSNSHWERDLKANAHEKERKSLTNAPYQYKVLLIGEYIKILLLL